MARSRLVLVPALVAVLSLVLAASGSAPHSGRAVSRNTAARLAKVFRVVAAGDIACPPGMAVEPDKCQQGATAALAQKLKPDLVLTLGDHQYQESSLAQ